MEQDPKNPAIQPAPEAKQPETVDLYQVYSLEELETREEFRRGRLHTTPGVAFCDAC